jgi:ribonuclease VapC
MSAASYLECGIVIDREKSDEYSLSLDNIIQVLDITIEPVSPSQARIARSAYRAYAKRISRETQLW